MQSLIQCSEISADLCLDKSSDDILNKPEVNVLKFSKTADVSINRLLFYEILMLSFSFQSVLQRRVRLSRKRVGTTFPLMRVATTRLASGCHGSSRIKKKGTTSVPSLCSPRHQGAGTLRTTSNQQDSLSHKTTRRQTKLDSGYHLQLVGKKDKNLFVQRDLYKQKNEKKMCRIRGIYITRMQEGQ